MGVSNPFRGIFVAMVSPMTAEEEIDQPALAKFVDYLITEGGVQGIVPLGSTGEFYAFSPEERTLVLKTTLEAASGRVPVIAGTNAASTREVVEFSKQAEQAGAAGVLLAAPYYSLPTDDEMFEHFRAVNDAIGIPIMLYNYPGRTGVDMTPDLIVRLSELDQIQYIKESSGDVTRVSEIIRRCGENITVFCGCDTIALESFVLGAAGWVGGVANVIPELHVELYDLAAVKQDIPAAKDVHYRMLPLMALMEGGGKYTQFVKAGCGLIGHPVGPPRQPLLPPTMEELATLKETIDSVRG